MADRLPNRSSDDFEAPRHVAIIMDTEQLEAAIAEFRRRERRFGGPAVRTGS
jgi:undecaprenyl pyrophosphate synthase